MEKQQIGDKECKKKQEEAKLGEIQNKVVPVRHFSRHYKRIQLAKEILMHMAALHKKILSSNSPLASFGKPSLIALSGNTEEFMTSVVVLLLRISFACIDG